MTHTKRVQTGLPGRDSTRSEGTPAVVGARRALAALGVASGISLAALYGLYRSPFDLAWLGAALAATSVAGFFWLRRDGVAASTRDVILAMLGGTALTVAGTALGGPEAWLALALAAGAVGVFWYHTAGRDCTGKSGDGGTAGPAPGCVSLSVCRG